MFQKHAWGISIVPSQAASKRSAFQDVSDIHQVHLSQGFLEHDAIPALVGFSLNRLQQQVPIQNSIGCVWLVSLIATGGFEKHINVSAFGIELPIQCVQSGLASYLGNTTRGALAHERAGGCACMFLCCIGLELPPTGQVTNAFIAMRMYHGISARPSVVPELLWNISGVAWNYDWSFECSLQTIAAAVVTDYQDLVVMDILGCRTWL